MARGCALIDSRPDTAKICSDGRVHVDHAQLPAVFGGEKTFSHGLGQKLKTSMRAYVFRSALKADIATASFPAIQANIRVLHSNSDELCHPIQRCLAARYRPLFQLPQVN